MVLSTTFFKKTKKYFETTALAAFAGLFYTGEVERKAGYYKCEHCGHEQIISTGTYMRAPHLGRTRYMKCPACGKKSWQKKTLIKDD